MLTLCLCSIYENGSAGVSVSCPTLGSGVVEVKRNELTVSSSRDHNGIIIRTRPFPCNLRIIVADNTITSAWTGVSVWPMEKFEEEGVGGDPKLRLTCQDPLHTCVGCDIVVSGNTIPNPKSHGIYVDAPCSLTLNNHKCKVVGNVISNTRHLALLIARPCDEWSSGVECVDNVLLDTGELRPPFPGLTECLESGQCTRNCTGKRFELQEWWRCAQCNFTRENNLGMCRSCALTCHAGHTGVVLYSRGVGAFCDCETRKEGCPLFDCDPPLKDDAPQ